VGERILDADIDYANDFIKMICTTIGPGCPCSPQERARAMKVKEEMEKSMDDVHYEEFTCAPTAFLKWLQPAALLAVAAIASFYLSLDPAKAVFLSIIAFMIAKFIFLLMIFEFGLTREVIDVLYPRKKSANIIGKLGPNSGEELRHVILFCGHHDSVLQFTWLRYLKFGYYIAIGILFAGVIYLTALLGIRLFTLLAGIQVTWVITQLIVFSCSLLPAIFVIGMFFTERGKEGGSVPGAIDNLSAVSLVLAMGRIVMRNPDLIPPNTEIRFISFGCEEAGVRGSMNYVRSHLAELREKDAVCFNFESIHEPEITIFSSDCNGFVQHDRELVSSVADAAIVAGVPFLIKPMLFGGGNTDAMKFSASHIKALSLFGLKLPADMVAFYHQNTDNYDKVNVEALKNALKIAVTYLQRSK